VNGREPFPDLVMRPVAEQDLPALVRTLDGMSSESLYLRFFSLPVDHTRLVRRHLATVDHRDHEAFVVLDGSSIVAMAQWDRSTTAPDEAEVAVHVAEEWQHRGLGRALVRAIAGDAYRHGVHTLVASVLTANRSGRGLAHHQHPSSVTLDGPETRYRFDLAS
jgi:GNAT superfamily N-acetyltransferase